jgi:8-oxo-dGTP pyrophosphatase MutT (NUDIX family)
MEQQKYLRYSQFSVTNFLYCGDDYLFLKRAMNKRIDPGRLNGIGGRLEPGENFLEAAIRETKEESGYVIQTQDIKLAGVVKLAGGYAEDWLMCYFKIKVPDKKLPIGQHTDDGELIWLDKDKVLDSEYELVDDLNYCFKDIIAGEGVFFLDCQVNDQEKISRFSFSKLPQI